MLWYAIGGLFLVASICVNLLVMFAGDLEKKPQGRNESEMEQCQIAALKLS